MRGLGNTKGRFGGTCCLHLQNRRINRARTLGFAACFILVSRLAYSSTFTIEEIYFSETSVDFQGTTWCYILEDKTLQNNYFLSHLKIKCFTPHIWISSSSILLLLSIISLSLWRATNMFELNPDNNRYLHDWRFFLFPPTYYTNCWLPIQNDRETTEFWNTNLRRFKATARGESTFPLQHFTSGSFCDRPTRSNFIFTEVLFCL
jgi:hypothetical protein